MAYWWLATLAATATLAAIALGCTSAEEVPAVERRARQINEGIMCPVCPGESIDQSQHSLAVQMRGIVAEKLEQDLNVPGALGVMFELVRHVNTAIDDGELAHPDAEVIKTAFDGFDQVLGVIALRRVEDASPDVPVAEIERLIGERKTARTRRDFAAADAIRDDLVARGVILEDTPTGTRWNRK